MVLAVPNEATLRQVADALGAQSLTHALVVENEGKFANQATAIGVAPLTDRVAIRKAVSHLPLVR